MPGRENKQVILENCAPFTERINKICNPQVDNFKDLDVVMLMYNLIEHSDIFSKTSRSLYNFWRDEPSLSNAALVESE